MRFSTSLVSSQVGVILLQLGDVVQHLLLVLSRIASQLFLKTFDHLLLFILLSFCLFEFEFHVPKFLINVIGSLRLFLNFSGHISVLVPPCERLTCSFVPWSATL